MFFTSFCVQVSVALDLPNGTFLSINWWNLKCGKEYLTVETKRDVVSYYVSLIFHQISLI